jgi:hypothetical protein
MQEVITWFKGQAVGSYDSGIQKLVPRLNKCLDNAGNYVEKVMYRQIIRSVAFLQIKNVVIFKTFVSVLSGHASYVPVRM